MVQTPSPSLWDKFSNQAITVTLVLVGSLCTWYATDASTKAAISIDQAVTHERLAEHDRRFERLESTQKDQAAKEDARQERMDTKMDKVVEAQVRMRNDISSIKVDMSDFSHTVGDLKNFMIIANDPTRKH